MGQGRVDDCKEGAWRSIGCLVSDVMGTPCDLGRGGLAVDIQPLKRGKWHVIKTPFSMNS
jgi:hypothetical protein